MSQKEEKNAGTLIVSLDLELYWGMFDEVSLDEYGENIRGVHAVAPKILALFSEYGIHATWAAVGLMTCSSRAELESLLPPEALRPTYPSSMMSSYAHLASDAVGEGENDDPYHFGGSLMEAIKETPGQELGSHTFSHFYALEDGQTAEQFRADLGASKQALARHGTRLRSLVFARNQVNPEYFSLLSEAGVHCYRGVEDHAFYRPRSHGRQKSMLVRAGRFLDRYLPLSGHHTYPLSTVAKSGVPYNIPASRQLHPYSRALWMLEPLKRRRIKRAMTRAARRGEVCHIWWHPHNFGTYQKENLAGLRDLLEHYARLKERHGMKSCSMGEVAESMHNTYLT